MQGYTKCSYLETSSFFYFGKTHTEHESTNTEEAGNSTAAAGGQK